MIRFELETGKPIVLKTDLGPIMQTVSQIMKRSIQLNFERGGRPPWLPLKSGGETPLVGSGRLKGTIDSRSGGNWAEVGAGAGLRYAWIHHKGGTIAHPGSKKLQSFVIDGTRITVRGTKPHAIHIPARPYMVLQREDLTRIAKMIGRFIVQSPGGEDAIY